MLDTNVLGMLCHPRRYADVKEWARPILSTPTENHRLLVPEIADYELRRKLLHINATASLRILDSFRAPSLFVAINSDVMLRASALWARARTMGRPAAGESALDGDMILAAQAEMAGAIVVTTNAKHLASVVPTLAWPVLSDR